MPSRRKLMFLLCLRTLPLFLYVELRMLSNDNGDIQALATDVFLLTPVNQLSQVGQLVSNINQTKIEVLSQKVAVVISSHHLEDVPEKYLGPSELMHDMNYFSACLLVMDDNFRLYEWIAYHYHVLSSRYLVVAADARSKNFPNPVLDLFRQQLNMTILSWNDSDYTSWDEALPSDAAISEKRQRYLARQRRFIGQCLHHMHQQNRTSTALVCDIDEYIAFNRYNWTRRNAATIYPRPHPTICQIAGSILRYLKDFGHESLSRGKHGDSISHERVSSL